jgi:hypothetical protein
MLRTFIRFSAVDYCLESETECVNISEVEYCEEHFDSILPAKAGDTISFIVDKAEYDLLINAIHLRAALTTCGILQQLDIATVENSTNQLYFTCVLPSDLENGAYEITIYKDYALFISAFTPESSGGACDGTFTVEVQSPPAIDFEFSLDQITWVANGVFTGICATPYTIYVREVGDTDCISGTLNFDATPLECSDYKGFTLQQFIDSGIFMIQLQDCTIYDLS